MSLPCRRHNVLRADNQKKNGLPNWGSPFSRWEPQTAIPAMTENLQRDADVKKITKTYELENKKFLFYKKPQIDKKMIAFL